MADLIGQHLGNYEIISPLGQGGMATVYRARQTTMKRDVAIKVITQQHAGDTEFTKRFEREVETIASLSHAHILKVFDYGKHEGMVYLVMELLTGGSLADKISAGAIPPKKVKALLNQITSALDYAHRRGIIHRDLKPQNVMLDEGGNAFLTDFGIAKIVSSNQAATATKAGAIMGTPYYMAPEQWRGDPVDARTDIYALGTILYEMLLGRLPFDADTAFVLMHKHVNEPPPLAELREKFSVAVSHAVSTAMAKDPAQRYASAGDLAKAFEDALEGTFLSDTTSPPIVTLIDVPLERATGTMPTVGASTMGRASTVIGEGGGSTPSGTPTSLFKPGEEPQAKQRGWLIPALVGVVGVLVVVVAILALNRSATVSLTPTAAALAAATTDAPSITPSLTNTASATVTASPTDEPPPLTQAVLILTERVTQTANAVASFTKTPTPNLRATAVALVQQQDTATA
ncbi:MAG TPA: serine/threonine-protein kinase [Aggregatilineales bacterium]|nr:serine/threonine-protein kinase [Aggregatilineales bacterium]